MLTCSTSGSTHSKRGEMQPSGHCVPPTSLWESEMCINQKQLAATSRLASTEALTHNHHKPLSKTSHYTYFSGIRLLVCFLLPKYSIHSTPKFYMTEPYWFWKKTVKNGRYTESDIWLAEPGSPSSNERGDGTCWQFHHYPFSEQFNIITCWQANHPEKKAIILKWRGSREVTLQKESPVNIWSRETQRESLSPWQVETEYMNTRILWSQCMGTMKHTQKHTLLQQLSHLYKRLINYLSITNLSHFLTEILALYRMIWFLAPHHHMRDNWEKVDPSLFKGDR